MHHTIEKHQRRGDVDELYMSGGFEITFADILGELLAIATQRHFLSCMSLLLENGANVDSRLNGFTNSLIYTAVERRSLSAVQLLLRYGAPLSNELPVPPLALAAHNGEIEIMRSLLEAGADADIEVDVEGEVRDLAQAAAGYRNGDMMRLLLDSGVNINDWWYEPEGHPLTIAASSGNIDVVRLLLDKGVLHDIVRRAYRKSFDPEIRQVLLEAQSWRETQRVEMPL